jgi:hypothetical protein
MIWFGHPAISQKLLLVMALINLFIFILTVTLAIPIHMQLAQMKSVELIDKLIFYDRHLRIIPGLVGIILNCIMLHQIIRKTTA